MNFFDKLKPKPKEKQKLIQTHATQTVADIAIIIDGISQEQAFLAKYNCPIKTDRGYFSHQEINNGVSCAGHVIANLFNIRESGQHNGYKYYLEMLRMQNSAEDYSGKLNRLLTQEKIGFEQIDLAIKENTLLGYLKNRSRTLLNAEEIKPTVYSITNNLKELFPQNKESAIDALLCVSSDHYYGYVKNTKGQRYYIDSMSKVGAIPISPQEIAQKLAENIHNGTILTIFPLTYEDKIANIEFKFG